MVPHGIKEKFEDYRSLLEILLRNFLNLPTKYQERFMVLIENFLNDCKRIHLEGKNIKEKVVTLNVFNIILPENNQSTYIVCAKSADLKDTVNIPYPITKPQPRKGSRIYFTVYSLDDQIWYSSKEELITKR